MADKRAYWHGRPVAGSDPETFRELTPHFAKDNSSVYGWCVWTRRVFKLRADPRGFKVLSETYATDTRRVFFADSRYSCFTESLDQRSFEVLSNAYSRDKSTVHFGYEDLRGVLPSSARIVAPFLLADGSRVLWGQTALDELEEGLSAQDVSFADWQWLISKAGVFFRDRFMTSEVSRVEGADPDSFRPIGGSFCRDDRHVFHENLCIDEADPNTFVVVADSIGHDGLRVFCGRNLIEGADPHSLRLLEYPDWADAIPGIASQEAQDRIDEAFDPMSTLFTRDAGHVYYGRTVLSGIDPGHVARPPLAQFPLHHQLYF